MADSTSANPAGGALFAEVGFNLVAGDRLHPAAFQIVVAAVEHFVRVRKFIEVPLYDILHNLVGGSASGCGARSLSFFSVSRWKCASMPFKIM